MILSIIQNLVPHLGYNTFSYDPVTLVNGLKASPSGPCKKNHSKAQEIDDVLNFLKEHYDPHKLLLQCLEQLCTTINYKIRLLFY